MKEIRSVCMCLILICSLACAWLGPTREAAIIESPARTLGQAQTVAPPTIAAAATSDALAGLRITHGPYLQAPSETGITILWATNKNCVSKIEYGTSPSAAMVAFNSQHGLIDANTTLHNVRIGGLRPGTRYYYRLVSTEIRDFQPYKVQFGETARSDWHSFTTLNCKKVGFSFVVLNDRHEKVEPFNLALRSIRWDGVDLVILNGDMLDHVASEPQIFRSVVDPCVGAFAKRIPFIFVRGNHDARGSFARRLMDYFPTENQRYYHSFNHGNVHFIVLDSGEDKEDSSREYSGLVDFDRYRSEQTEWLKKDIRSDGFRKATFRVVIVHIPPDAANHGAEEVRKKWEPLFRAAKIDLLISAHMHRYARRTRGDGKYAYPLVIGDTNTVIRADVSDAIMRLTVAKDDGEAVDQFTVEKKLRYWDRLFSRKQSRMSHQP